MNPSIHNIGDAASAALVEAGKVSIEIAERYCVLVDDVGGEEAVIYALNERGELGIDGAATIAVRQARKAPVAIRENLKLERPEDVVNHVLRFKAPGTVIFARKPVFKMTDGEAHAVIDYSENRKAPAWNRQHASAPIAMSDDTRKWHEVFHTQMDFAALIDDFAADVCGDPSGDMLLEMAANLEVTDIKVTGYKRNKATRLYDVTLTGKTETTTVVYPKFKLMMPIFADQPNVEVEIRLELEKKDGVYGFRTRVHRFDKLVQVEFDKVCSTLAEKTGVPVWQGQAPGQMGCGV